MMAMKMTKHIPNSVDCDTLQNASYWSKTTSYFTSCLIGYLSYRFFEMGQPGFPLFSIVVIISLLGKSFCDSHSLQSTIQNECLGALENNENYYLEH
jgi:hypothetical protein